MTKSATRIQDKDTQKRLSVVQSTEDPTKYGVVLLNPDGTRIRGPQGEPGEAATVEVGSTTTGNPGTNASVENSGSSSHAILNFTIPRGDKGDTGNGIINTVKNKVGKVTTVTFTYANGNTFDFSVSDGEDGEGSGDVMGPSSSSDGHLALFDGNTGKLLKNGGAIQDNLTTNVSTDVLSAKQGKALKDSIDTINGKIPSAATTSNQLADKDFVNSSINSVAAYYITKNAQGDQFATYLELSSATTFYSGGVARIPTRNDYCIVQADENHDNATTRYTYNNGWEFQYVVNETALTSAQLNALNSGITSGKVSTYDGYATSKQDKLVNQTNIKSINGNSLLGSGDLEIAGGHDYSWKTKTGASFKIDLRSYIEPSQNFTVNLPDELEDGMEYVLRCVNGATAYTMTLGAGFTNPRNVSLSLNSYVSDQFVFVAINGGLELQPEPQLK